MESLDARTVEAFLSALGVRQNDSAELELLGGCALILLGSQRTTMDIDYVGDDLTQTEFQRTIESVASDMHVHADAVPIDRFVPVPADAPSRRVFIARHGAVDVFVIDPYIIALSKLDRGFDSDLADIAFLAERGRVDLDRLAELITSSEPAATVYDLDPSAMRRHLEDVRRGLRDR